MNGLREAHHLFDRCVPGDMRSPAEKDIEFDPDFHVSRFTRRAIVTDSMVEQFIADLDSAPNKDIFIENTFGGLPGSASREYELHIAAASVWVHDKASVPPAIGRVFWRWAKNAASTIAENRAAVENSPFASILANQAG